jgi:hypothetical protein
MKRLALLAATSFAVLGLSPAPAQACVGTPCTLMCDVYTSHAYRAVLGEHPCPR